MQKKPVKDPEERLLDILDGHEIEEDSVWLAMLMAPRNDARCAACKGRFHPDHLAANGLCEACRWERREAPQGGNFWVGLRTALCLSSLAFLVALFLYYMVGIIIAAWGGPS